MTNPLKDPSQWIPKSLFLAYVGEQETSKLAQFYDKAVTKKSMMSLSLNWLAILLFPAWIGYRRQKSLWAIYTALYIGLIIVEALFQFETPDAALGGMSIMLGLQANAILLSFAHNRYSKLKKTGIDDAAIGDLLNKQAAGSVPYAIVSAVGFILILILAYAILTIMGMTIPE